MIRRAFSVQFVDQRWRVLQERATISTHTFRSEAVSAAVVVAAAQAPSSLKVCRMAGTIEDEQHFDLPA